MKNGEEAKILETDSTTLLPDVVYQNLRAQILSGILKPGQKLRQEELSRELEVSRVPLREAMTRLAADGLIVLNPRRGYAVTSLQSNEILEILELRAVVEEHAAYRAAYARTKEDLAEVERILKASEAVSLRSGRNIESWSQLNYQFHARIIASSGREHLARFATLLRDTVEPYIRVEVNMTGDVEEAQHDHRQLFAAYRDGDAPELARLSRLHVERTAQRLLRGLRERQSGPEEAHSRKGHKRPVTVS
ncbi:MAG TPA: GntR family transcriptional regulator [Burkholderiaceae bacterium]|nr:GntR family transcriptional regulator [Burkholderiaceae bacterium]